MPYAYKQLTGADLAPFRELTALLGAAFDQRDIYQPHASSDEYLRALLSKPDFIALVALDGASIIGGLTAYVLQKFEQPRREVYVYDLAVTAEHRRKRVATGLIRELQRIARALGAYVIFVQADEADEAAIRLYGSLGGRERVFHFDIPVD
jgi:aminoglycoside 3-N-acetyltransferase I